MKRIVTFTAIVSAFFIFSCQFFQSNSGPEQSDSLAFWNLHDTVNYVGMKECQTCHSNVHETFIHTGMGKSFGAATPEKSSAQFPLNGQEILVFKGDKASPVIKDPKTNRWYQAFWNKDSLFIAEHTLFGGQIVGSRKEYIPFIIGSGQHTNSHFWQDGNYLYQAPLTYYTQKGIWDLPPGFKENNSGFARKIDVECMSCHNAMPTVNKESKNFFEKIPLGIDCERCHGPGELHVNLKKQGILVDTSKEADRSIVNPKRLSYQRQVDICQRCHLQGNNVLKPGKHFEDFRPGMKLSDVFEVYMPKYENNDYFVMAGHSDRFQQSECFIKTNPKNTDVYDKKVNFTCISCHNPHVSVKATRIQTFNNTCRGCHNEQSQKSEFKGCLLPPKKQINQNGCVGCHMPGSGAEDIPHVMVHDHKIQRPQKTSNLDATKGALLGLHAVNNKNPKSADQIRGYISYFEKFDDKTLYLDKAKELMGSENEVELKIHLNFVKRQFQQVVDLTNEDIDAVSESNDAWTNYRVAKSFDELKMLGKALPFYKRAHELMKLDLDFGSEYANALIRSKKLSDAEILLKSQLSRAQKHPLTWINWGSVNFLTNKLTEAKRAYLKVLELEPNNQTAHLFLSELYDRVGDVEKKKVHLKFLNQAR